MKITRRSVKKRSRRSTKNKRSRKRSTKNKKSRSTKNKRSRQRYTKSKRSRQRSTKSKRRDPEDPHFNQDLMQEVLNDKSPECNYCAEDLKLWLERDDKDIDQRKAQMYLSELTTISVMKSDIEFLIKHQEIRKEAQDWLRNSEPEDLKLVLNTVINKITKTQTTASGIALGIPGIYDIIKLNELPNHTWEELTPERPISEEIKNEVLESWCSESTKGKSRGIGGYATSVCIPYIFSIGLSKVYESWSKHEYNKDCKESFDKHNIDDQESFFIGKLLCLLIDNIYPKLRNIPEQNLLREFKNKWMNCLLNLIIENWIYSNDDLQEIGEGEKTFENLNDRLIENEL